MQQIIQVDTRLQCPKQILALFLHEMNGSVLNTEKHVNRDFVHTK